MKIRELIAESAMFELRRTVGAKLSEAINKHLLTAAVALGNRSDSDKSTKGIDIDQLASIIAAMKIIAKAEYREVMTKDDIGINPRNAKELFGVLDKIPDAPAAELTGLSKEVINALVHLAPTLKKAEAEKLAGLTSSDPAERAEAVVYLKQFATKVDQSFTKVRAAAVAASAKAA